MKMVINLDSMKCIEHFPESKTAEIFEKYVNHPDFEEIGIDIDGDIVVSESSND